MAAAPSATAHPSSTTATTAAGTTPRAGGTRRPARNQTRRGYRPGQDPAERR
jgi:hypothetical protein